MVNGKLIRNGGLLADHLIENLTICRAATCVAESQFLNQVFNYLNLITATSPRISIRKKIKNEEEEEEAGHA